MQKIAEAESTAALFYKHTRARALHTQTFTHHYCAAVAFATETVDVARGKACGARAGTAVELSKMGWVMIR